MVDVPIGMFYSSVGIFRFKLGLFWLQEEAQAPSLLSSQEEGPKMETSCVALWVGDEVSLLTKKQASRLVVPEKPVRWRWKKRKFGLSTLDKFCSYDYDFLALPRLLKSLSNKGLHEKNISSCLSRVAVLRGVFDFNHSGSPINPKTMVLIWDTGASAGLTPFVGRRGTN